MEKPKKKTKNNTSSKRRDKILKFISKVSRIITWILVAFKLQGAGPIKLYIPLLTELERVFKTRGEVGLITYVKAIRTNLLNYLSGNTVRVKGVEMTKDGFPRILVPIFDKYKYGEFPVSRLQVVLSILYSTRALNLGKKPDIKPITSAGVILPTGIDKYTVSFWKELGYRPSTKKVPKSLNFKAYHFTTKSGPNGHALCTAITDLFSLPIDLIESIKVVGGKLISDRIDNLFSSKHLIPPYEENKIYRKITHFPDKEYKVRVIAILDYWSQTVLKPLHSFLANALKKIDQDQTFHQGAFKDKLKDCEIFYSVDLTAATDRFPITLISLILKGLLPSNYVDH